MSDELKLPRLLVRFAHYGSNVHSRRADDSVRYTIAESSERRATIGKKRLLATSPRRKKNGS